MSIPVVCPICRKRAKVSDELSGRLAECRKCGAPIRVPVNLDNAPIAATDGDVDDPVATARPGRHVSSSRWTKWSLAGAREYWVGRRMRRAAGLEEDDEPKTVYRRRVKLVGRGGVSVSLGYLLMVPSFVGIVLSAVVLFAVAAFEEGPAVSHLTMIPEALLPAVVLIGATASSLLGLVGYCFTSKRKVTFGGTEAVVSPTR